MKILIHFLLIAFVGHVFSSQQVNPSSGPTYNTSVYPRIAMNDSGQAVIAYVVQNPDNTLSIYASSRNNSSAAWSLPVRVSKAITSVLPPPVTSLEVVINASGQSIIVWSVFQPGVPDALLNIYTSSRSSFTGSWTDPEKLSRDATENFSAYPLVALNDSGQAVVVWGTSLPNVYISSRESFTGSWTNPVQLSTTAETENLSAYPQVALNNSGQTIVTWTVVIAPGRGNIYTSSRSNFSGSWTEPGKRSTGDSSDLSFSSYVALNDSGQAIVLWYAPNALYTASKNSFGESWLAPTKITAQGVQKNISDDGIPLSVLRPLALNNSGQAIITWFAGVGEVSNIYSSSRKSFSSTWTLPTKRSTGESSGLSALSGVVLNSVGQAILMWYALDNPSSEDVSRLYTSSKNAFESDWTNPSKVPIGKVTGLTADIVLNKAGISVVSWGGNSNIFERTSNFSGITNQADQIWNVYKNFNKIHPQLGSR